MWLRRLYAQPCAVFFAWLALVKGVPAVLGVHSIISTPESRYADWTLSLWGAQLTAAGTIIAIAIMRGSADCQRLGFRLLAIGTIYDLIAILYYYGLHQPAYTVLYVGFSVACIVRGLRPDRQGAPRSRVNGRVG